MSVGFAPVLRLCVLALMALSGVVGCSTSSEMTLPGLADRVELNGVPYFRGQAYQGAALALATLLANQGVVTTPGLLEKDLGLPADVAHVDRKIAPAARQYGMIVYPLEPRAEALLTQVSAGFPVLVRYQEGTGFWTGPRYAVLVGYDRYKQRVMLRSGDNRRLLLGFDDFSDRWRSAGSWAILVQTPAQLPAQVDRQRWLQAAEESARAGQEKAAAQASQALHGR